MLALLFSLSVMGMAQTTSPTSTPSPQTVTIQRWEYASITQLTSLKIYTLRLPDRAINDKTMGGVAAQLLGRPVADNEAPLYIVPQFLGDQGWELVSVALRDNDAFYWFKRPLK